MDASCSLVPDGIYGKLQLACYFAVAVSLDKTHAHDLPAFGGKMVDITQQEP
jgi:hypothetical protein